ncbi:ankyrin [Cucurbitaria berberidis CBS 394.84]|uniref:Ankyrin n=1 Tax=Cucurbitaria berberidis CBS 394.84 TaxID=1168544 RepID=A0A9P4GRD7_9PLEO|nr:ankyrin [Cucurbitaria berberidis CBS 394.84]KAF1850427.1 ankyrin [Cucurbitaria berberidis CBS 394.84]
MQVSPVAPNHPGYRCPSFQSQPRIRYSLTGVPHWLYTYLRKLMHSIESCRSTSRLDKLTPLYAEMMASELFKCDTCSKSFDTLGRFNQHKKTHSKPFGCEICHRGFALRLDLNRHVKARHRVGHEKYRCHIEHCQFRTIRKDHLSRHLSKIHGNPSKTRKEASSLDINDPAPRSSPLSSTKLGHTGYLHTCSTFMQAASLGNITLLEAALDAGIALETIANDGSTALHCAARAGQAMSVQYLLEKGANAERRNDKGRIPLYEALLSQNPGTVNVLLHGTAEIINLDSIEYYLARSGSIEVLQVYIKHPRTTFASHNAQNLLTAASKMGQTSIVAAMLQHSDIDVNKKDPTGNAPIHQAARYGFIEVMQLLLSSQGIDLNVQTRVNRLTPLYIAVLKGHFDIFRLLLDQVAAVANPAASTDCISPLLVPIQGHPNVVKSLISQDGIDINCKNKNLQTPLHLAASQGCTNFVKHLCRQDNVETSCKDKFLQTPLHLAASQGHVEAVKCLIRFADSGCTDDNKQTAVHLTAFNGHWETVHTLLEHQGYPMKCTNMPDQASLMKEIDKTEVIRRLLRRADFQDVNFIDKSPRFKETLLTTAVHRGDCEIIRVLLAHPDINVNKMNNNRYSPLMTAAWYSQLDAGRLLLEHKDIDIDFSREDGYFGCDWTALKYARERGHKEFVNLLLYYGATDDEAGSTTTAGEESNVAGPTRLVELQDNALTKPELEAQPYSFMDEYINDDPMYDLEMADTEDLDMTA